MFVLNYVDFNGDSENVGTFKRLEEAQEAATRAAKDAGVWLDSYEWTRSETLNPAQYPLWTLSNGYRRWEVEEA